MRLPASLRRTIVLLLTLAASAVLAFGEPLSRQQLAGRWDTTSYTIMADSLPGETVHMEPGTMVFTYRPDGAWSMEAADPGHTKLSGTYTIKGSELILTKADGTPYQDFQVQITDSGTGMTLSDSRSRLTATKLNPAP
jgi:hypothetical protein